MTNDLSELKNAIYNAASGSENRLVMAGMPSPSTDATLKLQRRIVRFLEDVDSDMTVGELLDQLRLLEEQ